ncbi:MAG: C39 family peptidase [Candidatus Nomurabacteria bacterium]|nr:MAG: C39 family peptidase [Candidatus Nomurabacteria bacterium]
MKKVLFLLCLILCLLFFQKAEAATFIDSDITEDQHWTLEGSPYVIDGAITTDFGTIVTIDPDVTVKFTENSLLVFYGDIIANGVDGFEIVFTAYSDDDYGGNTDGVFGSKYKGYWVGLFLYGQNNVMDSVFIRYSGGAFVPGFDTEYDQALRVFGELDSTDLTIGSSNGSLYVGPDANVSISDFWMTSSGPVGALVEGFLDIFDAHVVTNTVNFKVAGNGRLVCDDCFIQDTFLVDSKGIYVTDNGSIDIKNSFFENPVRGIDFNYSDNFIPEGFVENSVSNTVFKGHNYSAVSFDESRPTNFKNNTLKLSNRGIWVENYTDLSNLDFRYNWWGDAAGPNHPSFNKTAKGLSVASVSEKQVFYPWLNCDPIYDDNCEGYLSAHFSELGQYKVDGTSVVPEGGENMSGRFYFKGELFNSDSPAKMQIEIKESNSDFDGLDLHESDFVSAGEVAEIFVEQIPRGNYHWRSRAVLDSGEEGEWEEFGVSGNTDFVANTVPHYTQTRSIYPSLEDSDLWSTEVYAEGKASGPSSCGLNIGACGCAITSAVMVLRYSDILEKNGVNTDPGTLNTWLEENNGYSHGGALSWYKVSEYSGGILSYDNRSGNYTDKFELLDEYMDSDMPVIARMDRGRGANSQHFVVISNKLDSSYEVLDPAWYNTKTLNDGYTSESGATVKVRDYEGGFDGLRLFRASDGIAQNYTTISMSSPADILVTDSYGRRVGKNSSTGEEYREIPGSSYVSEVYDSPEGGDLSDHEWKFVYLEDLEDENIDIQVFGTGDGEYTLEYSGKNEVGEDINSSFSSNITNGEIIDFDLDENMDLEKTNFLEGEIYFDPESETSIYGSNFENAQISENENFINIDLEDNITTLLLEENQGFAGCDLSDFDIKRSIRGVVYDGEIYKYPKNVFGVDWQKSKSGNIHQLTQILCVHGKYNIRLEYHKNTNKTQVKINFFTGESFVYYYEGIKTLKVKTDKGDIKYEY